MPIFYHGGSIVLAKFITIKEKFMMNENMENSAISNNSQPVVKSSSSGVLGSLVFLAVMVGIMIVLSHIMN